MWLVAIISYFSLVILTFIPILITLISQVKLYDGGPSPSESRLFSEDVIERLNQNHQRILGTLGYWKKQAVLYKKLHYYFLGWLIPSSILIPVLSQAITEDPYSRLFLLLVAVFSTIILSFHRWLKVEQNFKAFRQCESNYYDLRRRLMDKPEHFGNSESTQIKSYFRQVEQIRKSARDAEIDNFPRSEVNLPPYEREH